MAILGIGIDILSVHRINALLTRRKRPDHFARRILSAIEYEEYISSKRGLLHPQEQCLFLATRWAVKEAAYKAMSSIKRLTWHDLTLKKSELSS